MALLTRSTQKVFGSTAGINQIAEFGSLANGTPATYSGSTISPAIVQTLSQYLSGWFSAVIGANSPPMEDLNALFYLLSYQLAYLFQEGIPEWDSATTYALGSYVNVAGILYVSLQTNNTGNATSSVTWWRIAAGGPNIVSISSASSPYTLAAGDSGKIFLVNSATGAMQFNLPAASLNFQFTVKDVAGSLSVNNISIVRHGSESIENVAATYVAAANYGEWDFACDATNWWIIRK